MKKVCLFFMILSTVLLGEIKVRIVEPLKFRDINATEIGPNQVLATSQIEIFTDNKEEDIGKRVVFKYPEYMMLSNRKKWIKINKIGMEIKEQELILERERVPVIFYAVLDKRELDKGEQINIIEGEYSGKFPIVYSVYKRKNNYPVTLPEIHPEDRPTILPIFPDQEENKPVVLPIYPSDTNKPSNKKEV
ncbi:hypothetical protein HMPREF0202_01832 [Cetobacterium somerae ATCC BAA-474]|uniref:Uncharacterized protein n=1 Tax=Cetobacterium somerae ATCC BAA-474 TaxID=1319815 RepID=U7V993_9FUSO|nr:hypothetical protein [Cetobacterium somerae]ERT68262.1 hypothetical protein HMPREF0202_01832 [Cetobacterium somerae ATCC BAA-474]